jgi:peptidoglycan recognition protein
MRVGRVAWGGPLKPIGAAMQAPAASVTVHHSLAPALPASASVAAESAAMQLMHRHHTLANKWAGIGYNFCVFQSGTVYEGRGWGRIGAHAGTAAGNATSVGICFVIDGRKDAPTPAALAAFHALRREGVELRALAREHGVRLHRDWKDTECPGERVAAAVLAVQQPASPTPVVFRRGDRGDDVAALQELLVRLRYMTPGQMDTGPGVFGPQTERALRAFHAAHSD